MHLSQSCWVQSACHRTDTPCVLDEGETVSPLAQDAEHTQCSLLPCSLTHTYTELVKPILDSLQMLLCKVCGCELAPSSLIDCGSCGWFYISECSNNACTVTMTSQAHVLLTSHKPACNLNTNLPLFLLMVQDSIYLSAHLPLDAVTVGYAQVW